MLTRCATGRVDGEHSLVGDVHDWNVERLEHYPGHLLAVGLGIERDLGEKSRLSSGDHHELVVAGVVLDLLHVVPVGDDAVLDRVLVGQNVSF